MRFIALFIIVFLGLSNQVIAQDFAVQRSNILAMIEKGSCPLTEFPHWSREDIYSGGDLAQNKEEFRTTFEKICKAEFQEVDKLVSENKCPYRLGLPRGYDYLFSRTHQADLYNKLRDTCPN